MWPNKGIWFYRSWCIVDKLELFGIWGLVLKLIGSYFENRMLQVQFINTDNICRKSDWVAVLKCVPQGSMLVPVMFILYVADDTSVMVQSHKEDED